MFYHDKLTVTYPKVTKKTPLYNFSQNLFAFLLKITIIYIIIRSIGFYLCNYILNIFFAFLNLKISFISEPGPNDSIRNKPVK